MDEKKKEALRKAGKDSACIKLIEGRLSPFIELLHRNDLITQNERTELNGKISPHPDSTVTDIFEYHLCNRNDDQFETLLKILRPEFEGVGARIKVFLHDNGAFSGDPMKMFTIVLKQKIQDTHEKLTDNWKQIIANNNIWIGDAYEQLKVVQAEADSPKKEINTSDDLFALFGEQTPMKTVSRILIQGDAGMGKTTYCSLLALEWKEGKADWTKKFDVVVLFQLRQVRKKTFMEVIKDEFEAFKETFELFAKLQEANEPEWKSKQERTLLIFDGCDELDESFAGELLKILGKKLFPYAKCLLTARNTYEPGAEQIDVLLRLEGIHPASIGSYLKKQEVPENEQQEILDDPQKMELFRIPLFLFMFCSWRDTPEIATSTNQYDLLQGMCTLLLKRYKERHKSKFNDGNFWKQVGKYAVEILQTNDKYKKLGRQIPLLARLSPWGGTEFQEFARQAGFLYISPACDPLRSHKKYIFTHQLFLEYFAVKYLTGVKGGWKSVLKRILKKHKKYEDHPRKCLCLQPLSYLMTANIDAYTRELVAKACLKQEKESAKVIEVRVPWCYEKRFPERFMQQLSKVVKVWTSSKASWDCYFIEVVLKSQYSADFSCSVKGVMDDSTPQCLQLNIVEKPGKEKQFAIQFMNQIAWPSSLTMLDLRKCHLEDQHFPDFLQMKELIIKGGRFGDKTLQELFKAAKKLETLQIIETKLPETLVLPQSLSSLELTGCEIQQQKFQTFTHLKKLRLKENSIDMDTLKPLLSAAKVLEELAMAKVACSGQTEWPHSLKQLELTDCRLSDIEFPSLPELNMLEITGDGIDQKSIVLLMEKATNLKTLKMKRVILLEQDKLNPELNELEMIDCGISSQMFPSFYQLRLLKISCERLDEKTLIELLKPAKSLEYLILNCKSLNVAAALKQIFQIGSLKSLDLNADHANVCYKNHDELAMKKVRLSERVEWPLSVSRLVWTDCLIKNQQFSESTQWRELEITGAEIDEDTLIRLLRSATSLEKLVIHCEVLNVAVALVPIFQIKSLKSLDLNAGREVVRYENPDELTMKGVQLSESVAWPLAVSRLEWTDCHIENQQFSESTQLKTMIILGGEIDDTSLLNLLKACKCLENLEINLAASHSEHVPEAIFSNPALKNVCFKAEDVNIAYAYDCELVLTSVKLPTSLLWPQSVKQLALSDCKMENQQFPAFKNIKFLRIAECHLDVGSWSTLIAGINSVQDLEKLFYLRDHSDLLQAVINLKLETAFSFTHDKFFLQHEKGALLLKGISVLKKLEWPTDLKKLELADVRLKEIQDQSFPNLRFLAITGSVMDEISVLNILTKTKLVEEVTIDTSVKNLTSMLDAAFGTKNLQKCHLKNRTGEAIFTGPSDLKMNTVTLLQPIIWPAAIKKLELVNCDFLLQHYPNFPELQELRVEAHTLDENKLIELLEGAQSLVKLTIACKVLNTDLVLTFVFKMKSLRELDFNAGNVTVRRSGDTELIFEAAKLCHSIEWPSLLKKLELTKCHIQDQKFPTFPHLAVFTFMGGTIDGLSLLKIFKSGAMLQELTIDTVFEPFEEILSAIFGLQHLQNFQFSHGNSILRYKANNELFMEALNFSHSVKWPTSFKQLEIIECRFENQEFPESAIAEGGISCLKITRCWFDEHSQKSLADHLSQTSSLEELELTFPTTCEPQEKIQPKSWSYLLENPKIVLSLKKLRLLDILPIRDGIDFIWSVQKLLELKELVITLSQDCQNEHEINFLRSLGEAIGKGVGSSSLPQESIAIPLHREKGSSLFGILLSSKKLEEFNATL